MNVEIQKISRTADMQISAHARLRDYYSELAVLLDVVMLLLAILLNATLFLTSDQGRIAIAGTAISAWIRWLALILFIFTVLQLRIDWKGTAEKHRQAVSAFTVIKRMCRELALSGKDSDPIAQQTVLDQYRALVENVVSIPEDKFLKLKKHHLVKVEISRYLDGHPGASLLILKLRLWWRDNFG